MFSVISKEIGSQSFPKITLFSIVAIFLLANPLLSSTNSRAYSGPNAPASTFHNLAKVNPSVAGTNGLFGDSVAISGSAIIVGAPGEVVSGNNLAGNAYIFNASKGGLIATLKDPNSQGAGEFGKSVAISESTAVVGAPYEGTGGNAYIFNARTGGLISTIHDPNAESGDGFGMSVAISGATVIVGAPFENSETGSTYIFSSTTGTLVKTLTSPNAASEGQFGSTVATNGTIVVVGAPGEKSSGNIGAGNVYTFVVATGKLSKSITSPHSQYEGQFGSVLAISGSIIVIGNPDEAVGGVVGSAYTFSATTGKLIKTLSSSKTGGIGSSVAISGTTALVGAPQQTAQSVSQAGKVYVLNATTGSLIKAPISPAPESSGRFGTSVGVSGTTAVIGAPFESASGYSNAGNAYVFNPTSGKLLLTISSPSTRLRSPNAQSSGAFGTAVAISENTIVVGAPSETAATESGAGNVYTFSASTGKLTGTLKDPNAQSSGNFGFAVAIAGSTIVVGAPGESSGAGNAYVFNSITGKLINTLKDPNSQSGGGFGTSVAISGTTIVIGAPTETAATFLQAGRAYTFNATTGSRISTFISPTPQDGGNFGFSVAITGISIVIGAPGETAVSHTDAGNTYTFNASTGKLLKTLKDPNAQSGGEFGTSVAISGTTIAVGAVFESAGGFNAAGNAYAFNATTGNFIATLNDPNAQAEGAFGNTVSVSGKSIVVGAPEETASSDSAAGNAYTFNPTSGKFMETLTSPNAVTSGAFGTAVAVSGGTIVVGAPGEATSGAGYSYIF
jgi:outer membrane protein assembly factor BamB